MQGGIHFHRDTGAHVFPLHQLPADIAGFVNRETSLNRLNALLEQHLGDDGTSRTASTLMAAITGAPGVGKTALALHWAHRIRRRFPDGDLYLDMRSYGSGPALSTEQALDIFLRSFRVDPESIPIDVDERAALYRSVIGTRRLLILVDNVASVKQIRFLLPGSSRCLLIATSRGMLSSLVAREGATRLTLDVLPPEDSVRLLAEIVGEDRIEADNAAANRIAQLCSHLPLALRVVAERTAGRPHLSLAEVADELVDEQRRLDTLASEEDELTDVRAVFSWSYRALTADQRRTFRLLGLHPGDEIGSAAAAALVGIPGSTVKRRLQELVDVHLLQEVTRDRFQLHSLLRAYSIERCQRETTQRERTHAIRRMQSWYLHTADRARQFILPYSHAIPLVAVDGIQIPPLATVAESTNWYEREHINILGVLRQAMDLGQYDLAWKLPVVADGFFELHSYWREWKQIHEDGLAAAQAIGDRLGEASNFLCLGDATWRLGQHHEALEHYEQAHTIARQIADHWLEGFALRGTGLIHEELGDTSRATDYFERALAVFRASGIERGEGMALLSIGKAQRSGGEIRSAVDYCRDAIEIFERIGDQWSIAWARLPLGQIYDEMGQSDEAEASLRAALRIFEEFRDRRSEAGTLDQLGGVLKRRGDIERSRDCWTRALEILETLDETHAESVRTKIAALAM
ncbi:ATP-binding protein [Saccharopolyspora phatthalungensis]|uniref:Tetratricopeptide (TPR) repeat protein n=1 Tax=Saccharopolyspora phatthalungensis TaxID=664693 RepID=A0A840QHQ8_9PSEU|nr:tetratricopeptide repeat protein [Saccharopolyspora phatthalungensis]MBB5159560.1 tetratricopeptide (TPR) repeat protein [Saccharopolyspora phatthalungensis]